MEINLNKGIKVGNILGLLGIITGLCFVLLILYGLFVLGLKLPAIIGLLLFLLLTGSIIKNRTDNKKLTKTEILQILSSIGLITTIWFFQWINSLPPDHTGISAIGLIPMFFIIVGPTAILSLISIFLSIAYLFTKPQTAEKEEDILIGKNNKSIEYLCSFIFLAALFFIVFYLFNQVIK